MFKLRDERLAAKIIAEIRKRDVRMTVMHVCGTHQDTLVRHGLDEVFLDLGIDVREGPGCPVCVTTTREIEEVRALAAAGKTITVYGDMLRAPGEKGSLADIRADGADVRVVYSVEDAIHMAKNEPNRDFVFFGVGFETTAPATGMAVLSGPPDNFSVYSVHKLTPPAIRGIAELGEVRLDGIILPGHVSAIIGKGPWEFASKEFGMPQVIAGFEPLDLLMGIFMLIKQKEEGRAEVEIEYNRVVKPEGNLMAQKVLSDVFRTVDTEWRGFPVLKGSGMELREKYDDNNARKIYEDVLEPLKDREFKDPPGCRCGEVIRGVIHSWECPLFGKACTPSKAVGPCMVSTEGACSIEYKFGKGRRKRDQT